MIETLLRVINHPAVERRSTCLRIKIVARRDEATTSGWLGTEDDDDGSKVGSRTLGLFTHSLVESLVDKNRRAECTKNLMNIRH